MSGWYYVVLDRDGGEIAVSDDLYATDDEALKAGEFHIDDPRYGSHYAEQESSQ